MEQGAMHLELNISLQIYK